MFKKQALVLVVSALAFTNVAHALGLGELELDSNLNEPLDADIELTQLRGLTADEIIPSLASNEAFIRAGIERSFFLSNIQFSVEENEAGNLVLALETSEAVREPFLNFLVEVNWPGGRLLKEYTVLLDPPIFDTGIIGESLLIDPAAQEPAAPEPEPPSLEISTSTTVSQESETTEPVPVAREPRVDNLAGDEYRVQLNDTLWEIAMQVPGRSGFTMQQVMLALQDVNPDAFLNSNINRLKAGSVLTFPTREQMAVRTVQEAIREVERQNQARSGTARSSQSAETTDVQLSATESTSSALPQEDGARDPDGYLEVSTEGDDGTSAGGESVDRDELESLENELAIASELTDQFERERDELRSRVSELEEQLAIMERMINIQNSDAAAFQSELSDQADDSGSNDSSSDEPMASGTGESGGSSAGNGGEPASSGPDEQQQPAVPESESESQPLGTSPAESAALGGIQQYTQPVVNWVMSSVVNMVAAGAAVLMVLLLPFYLSGRSKKKDEDESFLDLMDDAPDDVEAVFDQNFEDDLVDSFDGEDDLDPEASDATSDEVMEADMYMAYQKYDQAEEKLKLAFAEQPGRVDIGLKLLEVYAETGNNAAFVALRSKLSLSNDQKALADEYHSRMPILGNEDNSDAEHDDDLDFSQFGVDEDEAPVLTETPDSDETEQLRGLEEDFGYDAESSSEDTTTAFLDSTPEVSGNETEASSDLDFSLDLDDLDLPETDENDEGLDFDLQELGLEVDPPSSAVSGLDAGETDRGDLRSDFDFDELSVDVEPESEPDNSGPMQEPAASTSDETELDDDEYDFLSGNDEVSTKLDLARAYIEMEDKEGARDILEEVASEGTDEQKQQARELMEQV